MQKERTSKLRLSFQTKVLIPVLAFLIVLPAITVWILDRHIDNSAREEALKTLTTVRAVFRNSLDIRERNLEVRFKNMVNEPRFKAVAQLSDRETMRAYLEDDALKEFGEEVQIVLFTPADDSNQPTGVDHRGNADQIEFDSLATPIIDSALEGNISSSLGSLGETAFNLISVPVTISENSKPLGALTIWIELGQSAVNDLKSLTRTEVIIFENNKTLATTLDPSRLTDQITGFLFSSQANNEIVISTLIDDEHFHVLAGELSTHDATATSLSYVLLSSYEESIQALSSTRTKLLSISTFGIALSVTIILILVRNLTQPLRALRDGAEAVGKGDLNQQVDIKSTDECGALADAFNQMTSSLKSSRSQLETNVLELEETHRQLIQREALLRESEEGLKLIIEGARDHVIFTINDNGQILRWNGAAERMLGYLADEAKEINYNQFFDEKDRANAIHEFLIKTAKTEGRSEFEGWRVGKDGKRFWADVTISRLDHLPGEETGGYVEIARDISTRKKAEEALVEARNAAEDSNRAKNEFMGNMSHEIRTPMNGVIGMSSILLGEQLTNEQHDLAETIKDSADSLLEIIDDILDISKIESGQLEIVHASFDLVELLEGTVESFAHVCTEKGLTLHVYIAKEVPAIFESDGSRIRQVLSNLIGNAVKFTEKGGIRVEMGFSKETKEIVVTVKDTGIGIPEDKFDKLFTPFFQVESNNSRRFGGTGLGLSISRKIALLLNGEIKVQSVLNEGSTFTFTMKAQAIEEEAAFREFPGVKATFISDNVQCKSAISDQTGNWGCQITHMDICKENLSKAFNDESCKLLIIDDSESLKVLHTAMIKVENATLPYLRLLANNQQPESNWQGNGLVLHKPLKPTELNACFSKLLKNEVPIHSKKITPESNKGELNSDFAKQYPFDILIVEDNSINAKVMETILNKLGYSSDVAVNGEECLKALEEKAYDIIFMDLQMPVMDGYQATARILNSDTITHPVFITAFTANARQDDRDACKAVGMQDFVAKPARPHKITEVIQRAHVWFEEEVPVSD
jgi:PAS domain S-box-containing protein